MNTFFLTRETLTGIPTIDDQHREWLRHLRTALTVTQNGESIEDVARTLGFLVTYTMEHFTAEETCMRSHHYPGYAKHKASHDTLYQSLNDLLDSYQAHGSAGDVVTGLKSLMEEWFTGHLQTMDKGLARFLREKGMTDL